MSCKPIGLIVPILTLCVIAGPAEAQSLNFKSPAVKAAATRYTKAAEKLTGKYEKQIAALRTDLARDLRKAGVEATRKGQLDEAQAIKKTIESLDAGKSPITHPLERRLIGTQWRWSVCLGTQFKWNCFGRFCVSLLRAHL